MTKPVVYYWPPSTIAARTNAIASAASAAPNTFLPIKINTPATPPSVTVFTPAPPLPDTVTTYTSNQPGYFSYTNIINPTLTTPGINCNIIRSITITNNGPTAATFTVSGIGTPIDGLFNPTGIIKPISEVIVVGIGASITSLNIYTTIYSIFNSGLTNTTLIDVGYGPNGITSYYLMDLNRNVIQGYANSFSQQMQNNNTAETVAVYVSLNYPESSVGLPEGLNVGNGLTQFGVVNDSNIMFMPGYQYQVPTMNSQGPSLATFTNYTYTGISTIWANVAATTTDSLFFTIFQQGI